MKRNTMLSLLLVVALAFTAVFSGCSGTGKLAAKVGDQEITVTQIENMYTNNAPYAMYYGFSLTTAEGVEAYQDYLVNQAVTSALVAYKARQSGIALTEEEQAEAQKTADDNYTSTYQQFLDSAKQSGTTDPVAYANQNFAQALSQNHTTIAKLKQEMLQDAEDALLVEKHKTELLKDAAPTEEALKTAYDAELASQQALFDSDPSQYFSYQTNAGYGYGCGPLYMPAGFFYVSNLLVEDEETAKAVKAKLDAGEDFAALLAEYGTDEGMKAEANAEGYLVGQGAGFVEPFLNAALALEKEGDISDIVQSDYGYHIIKRLKDAQAGVIPYEQVKDTFNTYTTDTALSTKYNEIVEEWRGDETIVTLYPENYRMIGKSDLPEATATPEITTAPEAAAQDTAAPEAEATAAPSEVPAE